MEIAARIPRDVRPRIATGVFAASASLLGLLVGASFVIRAVVGAGRSTPAYFQDEYLYAELGRSLAESGRPLVRGAEVSFPALLQPLLTAPAWLLEDIGDSFRLIQLMGALAMSLAAVPVFLVARRLGLSRGLALGCAALAVAVPDLLYASWIVAEPFAYPLVLGAVAAATAALAGGSRRAGLAFLVLAGLAAFTRVQFVVLAPCFVAALVVVGARERRLRAALREQALVLAVLGAAATLALALGPVRLLGVYDGALSVDVSAGGLAGGLARNALGLLYASGWILVPGALLGLVLCLARPRSRDELAFAAVAATVTLAMLVEASVFGDAMWIQERYTFYAIPLLGPLFCLYAARGFPVRRAHLLLAVGAVALSAAVPLAGYTAGFAKAHSPFLLAVFRLELELGSPGDGSLAIAVAAALLSAASVVLARRARAGAGIPVALAVVACAAASLGVSALDTANTRAVRGAFLPSDPTWVDRAGLGQVALVHSLGLKTAAYEQLFWNRSLSDVLLMPGGRAVDGFSRELDIRRDGALLDGAEPLQSSLLVDERGTVTELYGAVPVASSPTFRLWRAVGTPRLRFYAVGFYNDGWLAGSGGMAVWSKRPGGRLEGWVSFRITAPESRQTPLSVSFRSAGGAEIKRLAAGDSTLVRLPVCASSRWSATFTAADMFSDGSRTLSAQSTPAVWRPGPGACGRTRSIPPTGSA